MRDLALPDVVPRLLHMPAEYLKAWFERFADQLEEEGLMELASEARRIAESHRSYGGSLRAGAGQIDIFGSPVGSRSIGFHRRSPDDGRRILQDWRRAMAKLSESSPEAHALLAQVMRESR